MVNESASCHYTEETTHGNVANQIPCLSEGKSNAFCHIGLVNNCQTVHFYKKKKKGENLSF
jgi:hypothetical protein